MDGRVSDLSDIFMLFIKIQKDSCSRVSFYLQTAHLVNYKKKHKTYCQKHIDPLTLNLTKIFTRRCVKNHMYSRHWIYQFVQIDAPIQKNTLVLKRQQVPGLKSYNKRKILKSPCFIVCLTKFWLANFCLFCPAWIALCQEHCGNLSVSCYFPDLINGKAVTRNAFSLF